ncbi:recombinase family protein [Nonomuraea sp. NPDC052265]|uniref:recombinase family protein n=1 Tax=Nonomuraea sp. NPDC052265 TaxID=3364374 RepID=UPI0037C98C9B
MTYAMHGPQPGGTLLAGLYARISNDREGRELGVTRQQEDGRALAARIGATIVDTYIDNDISASTRSRKRRPQFDRLLDDVRSGRINAVIYYSSSRLTRRPLEFETIIQLVEETGVMLFTVTAGTVDLTTPQGRMMGRFFAAKDAAEAEETQQKVLRTLHQNRELGKRPGGQHMKGWLKPDPLKGIGYMEVLDPEAVRWIDWAADWLIGGGSRGAVTRRWNKEGFTTTNGRQWVDSTVTTLLTSPRLAGMIFYDGELVGEGEWPKVLDPDKWRAMQLRLGQRKGYKEARTPIDKVRKHLLSGFVKCFECGSTMLVRRGPKRVHRFACVTAVRGGCGKLTRNMEWLEMVLDEYVTERIRTEEGEMPDQDASGEAAQLDARVRALENRVREVRDAAMQGVLPMVDAGQMMTELREGIDELRLEQAKAVAEQQAASMGQAEVLDIWNNTDPEYLGHRRQILGRYVKAIIIHPLPPNGYWRKHTIPLDSITIVPA